MGGIFSRLGGRARLSRLKRGVKRTQKAAPLNHAVAPDIAKSRSQVNRVVKRTQTAAPPHHAVAPDIAESRSQVNRVVRLNRNKRIKMFRQEL